MAGIALALFALDKKVLFVTVIILTTIFFYISLSILKKKQVAILLVAFLIGFCGLYIQNKTTVEDFSEVGNCYVEGKITKISTGDGYCKATLKIIKVDGFKVKGQAMLKVDANDFKVFDKIFFYGKMKNKEVNINNSSSLTYYGNGIYYDASIFVLLEHTKGPNGAFEIMKNSMIYPMRTYLTNENMGISKSLLFGDLSNLSGEDLSAIRASGLSHIFAVSGLHISFVVALIALLMKKLKMNKWLSLALTSIVLILYCGITGCPSSAIRASIMAIVYLLSIAIYRKADGLSALALATTIMLILSPRTMFSLSFIMSVGAVFGIMLFYKPIYKFFVGNTRNKFRNFVSGSFALSLSANIFLLLISMNVFGTISIYFVIANLIVLPIVTVCYTFLFITAVMCLFSQWFGFLFLVGNLFIEAIRLVAVGISFLPYSTLGTSSLGAFTIPYVLIMILISRFILLSKSQKLVGSISFMFIGIFLMIIV